MHHIVKLTLIITFHAKECQVKIVKAQLQWNP
jgi:hypothetical protein